ncbi:hypothetical protein [Hymenobacter nivis]|uniref:hypothetical protein n=1 Tax=Hymenobacter nivis TaxID=1850093 RepID=UPI0013755397|nr:hypothetical protein [Hymenobacter nivis]
MRTAKLPASTLLDSVRCHEHLVGPPAARSRTPPLRLAATPEDRTTTTIRALPADLLV